MQKYAQLIVVFFLAAFLTACGGSGTTAATAVYDHPTALAALNTHMGGAVQGTPLALNNIVSTFTGTPGNATGFSNYSTPNGPPAAFYRPTDITTDGSNFYVADYGNNAIRKVTPLGVVSTLQCTTDGTTPIGFNLPFSLTTDGTNIYVADYGSNSIRIINIVTNIVTTVGSTDTSAGSVDSTDRTVARFNRPTGITTDGNNLYVTDSGNNTIRRIDLKNNYAVSTLAGTSGTTGTDDGLQGAARFNLPERITTDGTSLYVTDFYNRTIRKIDILTGTVSTLAGSPGLLDLNTAGTDGIGSAARFNQPNGITTDGTYLYVTDSYRNTIRKIVIATGAVTTIPIPASSLHTPMGITTDGVSLYVADTSIENINNTYTYSNSIIKIQ